MIAAVPHVVRKGEDTDAFVRAIHAARLMGLRLDDCHRLRFDPAPGAHWLTLDIAQPVVTFSDAQKSGATEDVPLTAAAVTWLQACRQLSGSPEDAASGAGTRRRAGRAE